MTTAVGSGMRSALCAAFRSSGENCTSVVAMGSCSLLAKWCLSPYAGIKSQPLQRLHALCFILIADCVNSQLFRRLAVLGPVVDKGYFSGITLQDIKRQLEDFGVRLT